MRRRIVQLVAGKNQTALRAFLFALASRKVFTFPELSSFRDQRIAGFSAPRIVDGSRPHRGGFP